MRPTYFTALLAALLSVASAVVSLRGAEQAVSRPAQLPFLNWERLPSIPDYEGFAGMFAGVSGDSLLIAGGANFPGKRQFEGGVKTWYDAVYALPAPNGEWKAIGKLPRLNGYGVSVNALGGVIIAGGGDARIHFTDVFLLTWNGRDLATRPLPSLPRPCAFTSGALVGPVLYVACGIETPDATEALNNFWALDLTALDAGWRVLPPCPGPTRMLPVAAAVGDTFYLFSGVGLHAGSDGKRVRTFLKDAYSYTAKAGWRRLADLPAVAAAAPSPAPVTADGQPLVLSGDNGTLIHLDGPHHPGFQQTAFAYRPAENRWIKVGTTPFSRATVPTTYWRNQWIIPCGERIPGYRTPDVWSLDFAVPR